MADYFTNFSLILPLNPQQQAYAQDLAKHIEANRSEDQALPDTFPTELTGVSESWFIETECQEEGLWLQSQSGGQEAVCVFIQHLLQKFDFAPFVTFEWSHDCNQPRTDAFGGGAAYITATEIETFSTSEWLQKMTC